MVKCADSNQRGLPVVSKSLQRLEIGALQACWLSCRTLSKDGGLHFVFFLDPQPPVAVFNNSHADVEVRTRQPMSAEHIDEHGQ